MIAGSTNVLAENILTTQPQPTIVILRGPPASGKTSVSLVLREKLQPVARINIDSMRYMVTPRNFSPKFLRAIKLNSARLAVGYAQEGISSVIDSAFTDPQIVSKMCQIIENAGFEPMVFTLVPDVNILLDRNLNQELFERADPERLKQIISTYNWDVGTKITVKDREIEEVAADIYMHIEERYKNAK